MYDIILMEENVQKSKENMDKMYLLMKQACVPIEIKTANETKVYEGVITPNAWNILKYAYFEFQKYLETLDLSSYEETIRNNEFIFSNLKIKIL